MNILYIQVCEKKSLVTKKGRPNAKEFFIDHQYHLIWCNIFKAASSTWLHHFNLLGMLDKIEMSV
jgi:hypothetical protein